MTLSGLRPRLLLPLTLAAVLALGACSSDDGTESGGAGTPSASADGTTDGGATPETDAMGGDSTDPVTADTLPDLVTALKDAGTGRMSLRVTGTVARDLPLFLSSRAVWDFDADAASLSIVRAPGTSDVPRATLLEIGTQLYAGKPSPGSGPDCWSVMDSVDPEEIGDSGVPGRVPAVEAVLRFEAAKDGAGQRTNGTTAAAPILRMIGLTAVGDQVAAEARIPVRLDAAAGEIRRLLVRPGDVVRVLEDIGQQDATDLARAITRSEVRSWVASFDDFGDPATIREPSRAELRAGSSPACA